MLNMFRKDLNCVMTANNFVMTTLFVSVVSVYGVKDVEVKKDMNNGVYYIGYKASKIQKALIDTTCKFR